MHTIFEIAQGRLVADAANRAELEERVMNEGLRGRWYALTASRNVLARPLGIERMGERLVLWRDRSGALNVQDDRCPHRGARLSGGRVVEDRLMCPYHGVQISTDGKIAAVPALPDCPLEGREAVRTYEVREIGGVIFAYFPSPAQSEPIAFEPPFEFNDPEWAHMLCETTWTCNYRYAAENVVDPMHGPYLHGDSFTLRYGSPDDVMEITDKENGFIVARTKQRGVNFDWTEFTDSGAMWLRLDIPYPPGAGPGGPFRIIGAITPIDERSSQIFFWRFRHVTGWQRDLWRFMYRARLEERHWYVLEQDRTMLEGLPDDAREHEMLYQHDVGVTRLRRRLKALARAQIEAAHAQAQATASQRVPVTT
jgi:phenylpropionate dioxygenase-like ring-hydroxylating dioxygenase large terminal subunit